MAIDDKTRRRSALLDRDLATWSPRSWRINLPGRDYTVRPEDLIPALAGAIGKVSLVAAFAAAWADALGLTWPDFVAENVRLDMIIGSLILLLFCACLLPRSAPPGTLTPLIPMVPLMAAAGVHPLSLSLLIGILGLILSAGRVFPRLVKLNTPGTRGGILVLFGILGLRDSLGKVWIWAEGSGPLLFVAVLGAGLVVYLVLAARKLTWLAVPACLVAALAVSALFGQLPQLVTGPGLPLFSHASWWHDRWQLGSPFDLPTVLAAVPFALLALTLWPLDATAIMTMHEQQYQAHAAKATFDLNQSFLVISLRNIIGAWFGGAQTAAVWRSFLIPLGIVRRPIPGSALLLGLLCLIFALTGYPIDIAMHPPALHLVLMLGVYVPMLLAGIRAVRCRLDWLVLAAVLAGGFLLHPLAGWLIGLLLSRLSQVLIKKSMFFH